MHDVPKSDGSEPLREPPSLVRFAGLVLNLDARTLERESGEVIRLTRGEFALLRVFVTRPGRVVSRDVLLDALANRRFEPFDRSVDSLIVRLRRKIEPDPKAPRLIVTARGEGYRFDGLRFNPRQIAKLADADSVSRPEATPTAARASEGARPPAEAASRAAERRHITALAAELVWAEGTRRTTQRTCAWSSTHSAAYRPRRSVDMAPRSPKAEGARSPPISAIRQAQENDAERAVRAALAIQRALAEHQRQERRARARRQLCRAHRARIRDRSSSTRRAKCSATRRMSPRAYRPLPSRARCSSPRMFSARSPGCSSPRISGAHELKGVAEPVDALSHRARERRRGGSARARSPRWSGARRSSTSCVGAGSGRQEARASSSLIVGEPGIGKSRLVEEFRLKLGETPHTLVEWSSSQLLQNTPLHPIAEWGRQRFGADAPADQRLADLENTLAADRSRPRRICAPARAAGGHPAAGGARGEARARGIAPAAIGGADRVGSRRGAIAAGRARVRRPALGRSDLARSDAALSPSAARRRRSCILATARPEFRPPWSLRSHHSVISLSPLDRADVARMVGELAARHALSKEVVEGVSERTGGVPLFVEEVTRLLLERGEAGGLQAIPPTLQQSLAARLDRLGEAREVAQIGAVLGRDFTYALLRAVGGSRRPRPPVGARQARRRGPPHRRGRRPAGELSLQARADPGRGLRQPAQEPPPGAAPPRRGTPARRARARGGRAGSRSPIISPRPASTTSRSNGGARRAIRPLRRSAFQEAIAHLGKAIAMADKADGGRRRASRASGANCTSPTATR